MHDRDKIISAIENCIGQPKCRDCPWDDCEYEHEVVNSVPYGLLRDALALLKEQDSVDHALEVLRANGWKQTEPICSECDAVNVIQCKDCKHYEMPKFGELGYCNQNRMVTKTIWYCADGEGRS